MLSFNDIFKSDFLSSTNLNTFSVLDVLIALALAFVLGLYLGSPTVLGGGAKNIGRAIDRRCVKAQLRVSRVGPIRILPPLWGAAELWGSP